MKVLSWLGLRKSEAKSAPKKLPSVDCHVRNLLALGLPLPLVVLVIFLLQNQCGFEWFILPK